MTVKELIKALKKYDENMGVVIHFDIYDEDVCYADAVRDVYDVDEETVVIGNESV